MLSHEEKEKLVKQYQRGTNDTGSSEVQISLLTSAIAELSTHLESNKKDVVAKRSLLKKVAQRKRLLNYLVKSDYNRYKEIIKSLKLRK